MNVFAVVYRPGSRWNPDKRFHEQHDVMMHHDFLEIQHTNGRVLIAGPFLDDAGGLVVMRAESLDETQALVLTDETVRSGLLNFEIHPYAVVFSAISV